MAAYASLVSLMHTIDQIKHHPRPPISIDKQQVESLTEKLTFLQEFLEGYSLHVGYTKEPDALESRIAGAAYAAEDVIESHIVDQILPSEEISSTDLYGDIQKVIEDMESIKKEVMEIKEKMGVQHQLLQRSSTPAGSSRSSSTGQSMTMVGFDDVSLEIMDKLTGGQLDRQIIPIVGMCGIGKTTLARNIYANPLIVHFDIRVWVTISQQYKLGEVLSELLKGGGGNLSKMNEYELEEELHKRLSGRRYLIIMDDIWDVEVWDRLKRFFPDDKNGSRIILTTRLSNLASNVTDSRGIHMSFLDEDDSWKLFSKTVFGEEGCSLELEEIGKKIVRNCKGLPLSIVVIGGLLAKSKHTREYWEYIEENLNSIVNLEDNESCLKILHLSYEQLPVYLKPCFLYMGIFPEDSVIRVSKLIKLWVVEGFLKPISEKSLEETAKEFLKELIDRNLILVEKLGCTGKIKYCNIHDLVRDLCLREAQKEWFYNVTREDSLDVPQDINTQRRIVIPNSASKEKDVDALQSKSQLARSLICNSDGVLSSVNFRLLRILKTFDKCSGYDDMSYFLENMFQLVNSRYLAIIAHPNSEFPSSINLLWNLHTLIVENYEGIINAPVEIWNMSQLKQVEFRGLYLPNPPTGHVGGQDDTVLGNLQTLVGIIDFKCGEEVVKRIPNITKLSIEYMEVGGSSLYCLHNLDRLHKLESLSCYAVQEPKPSGADFLQNLMFPHTDFLQSLTFPHSLKKLNLDVCRCQYWDYMLEKIGSLPLLEKLKLNGGSFKGGKWETIEGQFPNLKFLQIDCCDGLEYWIAESSHFPRLEHLVLDTLLLLNEIPSGIGEIPTLQSIFMKWCSESVVISAKKIQEEQKELQGEVTLQVRVFGR